MFKFWKRWRYRSIVRFTLKNSAEIKCIEFRSKTIVIKLRLFNPIKLEMDLDKVIEKILDYNIMLSDSKGICYGGFRYIKVEPLPYTGLSTLTLIIGLPNKNMTQAVWEESLYEFGFCLTGNWAIFNYHDLNDGQKNQEEMD